MNTLDAMNWRYATKKFDTSNKLTDKQFEIISEAMRLAPSSYGLQPWKFVVVKDPAVREKLRAVAYDQPQVTDASHFIVLCVRTDVDAAFVDHFIQSVAATRNMPIEALSGYADLIKGAMGHMTPEQIVEWSSKQVYLALGVALLAAAENEIDTAPMEGFDKAAFDEILGLKEHKLESRVMLSLGFRDNADETMHYKKARFDADEVFVTV
jgi:nitroreductase/dihydropteridine reductase